MFQVVTPPVVLSVSQSLSLYIPATSILPLLSNPTPASGTPTSFSVPRPPTRQRLPDRQIPAPSYTRGFYFTLLSLVSQGGVSMVLHIPPPS